MPQEPEWNWKAVVAGALASLVFAVFYFQVVFFGMRRSFESKMRAEGAGLSAEERQQMRANKLEEAKHDPKRHQFSWRFKAGMVAMSCATGMLQGFVAGRLAKKHPLAHAGASYCFTLVMGHVMKEGLKRNESFRSRNTFKQNRPLKSQLSRHALSVASVLLGGYLSRQK